MWNFKHDHIRWIDIQEVVFFHAAIVSFSEGQNVTLLTVTLLTMIFWSSFKMRSQNIKFCLSAKIFAIKLVKCHTLLQVFPIWRKLLSKDIDFFRCPSFVTWLTNFQSDITTTKIKCIVDLEMVYLWYKTSSWNTCNFIMISMFGCDWSNT